MVLSVSDDLSSRLIGGFLLGGGEEGGDGEGDGESNDELGESGREDGASADSTRLSSLTAGMTTVYIIIECNCMHNACRSTWQCACSEERLTDNQSRLAH